MDRPVVVVAETIAEAGIEALEAHCEVLRAEDASREELMSALESASGLVVRSGTKVDAAMIAAAPDLEVIGRAGIGVDNIDVEAATAAGVLVVNAPNANTISAAEHTMALLLAQARMIPEADASLRSGVWEKSRFRGVELHGKTLAILGLGKIGSLVAERAAAFGMKVVAYDPYVGEELARRLGVELGGLDEVIARADFVTVHLPRTKATEGLIDKEFLAGAKPGMRLINVARGGIVDESALAEAVRSGHVAGAAFDVFSVEPATDSPLFELPTVVVTPHLGASTQEAQDKAGVAVAEAVADALRGELVLSAVNIDLGPTVSDDVKAYLALAEALGHVLVSMARGLPDVITVRVQGRLADFPVRPLTLGAIKGALAGVTSEVVSYVNAPGVAAAHGLTTREESIPESADYQAYLQLTGTIGGRRRIVAGTLMERKGPVLVQVDGYEIELPITPHMLLIRNEDIPGTIGRVGTLLGDADVNIADMVVGRHPQRGAMMGLSLYSPLPDGMLDQVVALDGVASARYIEPV
jgi:D-3-phosphoglycerate dehydrogenase